MSYSTAPNTTRFVSVVMGIVIGLTFLFGFGNVLTLALSLGVPPYVAPLVAPAVDMTVVGLLVGTRHLALACADDRVLRPARRLLLMASVTTLALNIAAPLLAGEWGKAAFDAVGPLLLIGWAEAGPDLLRALAGSAIPGPVHLPVSSGVEERTLASTSSHRAGAEELDHHRARRAGGVEADEKLLQHARLADAEHRRQHQRPISAETLRKRLRVGAASSRTLVAVVRAEKLSKPVHEDL